MLGYFSVAVKKWSQFSGYFRNYAVAPNICLDLKTTFEQIGFLFRPLKVLVLVFLFFFRFSTQNQVPQIIIGLGWMTYHIQAFSVVIQMTSEKMPKKFSSVEKTQFEFFGLSSNFERRKSTSRRIIGFYRRRISLFKPLKFKFALVNLVFVVFAPFWDSKNLKNLYKIFLIFFWKIVKIFFKVFSFFSYE